MKFPGLTRGGGPPKSTGAVEEKQVKIEIPLGKSNGHRYIYRVEFHTTYGRTKGGIKNREEKGEAEWRVPQNT